MKPKKHKKLKTTLLGSELTKFVLIARALERMPEYVRRNIIKALAALYL